MSNVEVESTGSLPVHGTIDAARASGGEAGTLETFEQLDQFVVTLRASVKES